MGGGWQTRPGKGFHLVCIVGCGCWLRFLSEWRVSVGVKKGLWVSEVVFTNFHVPFWLRMMFLSCYYCQSLLVHWRIKAFTCPLHLSVRCYFAHFVKSHSVISGPDSICPGSFCWFSAAILLSSSSICCLFSTWNSHFRRHKNIPNLCSYPCCSLPGSLRDTKHIPLHSSLCSFVFLVSPVLLWAAKFPSRNGTVCVIPFHILKYVGNSLEDSLTPCLKSFIIVIFSFFLWSLMVDVLFQRLFVYLCVTAEVLTDFLVVSWACSVCPKVYIFLIYYIFSH